MDVNKKSVQRLFRQLPSDEKAPGYGPGSNDVQGLPQSALLPVTACPPPSFKRDPGGILYVFYERAYRHRLEKLLYLGLSRSPSRYFISLLDPGGGFRSGTAISEVKWL